MDHRKAASPSQHKDSADNADTPRRQSFIEGLAGLVRDEVYDHVVNSASGGLLSYDGEEDEDPPRDAKPSDDGFNARLERALADMRAQQQAATSGPPQAAEIPIFPPPLRPMTSHLPPAVRGFGRKVV